MVDLTFRTNQATLRFEITDRGPGIEPARQAMIFEKFGLATACEKPSFRSTGLGLAFCKLAVEAHGGRIGVTSTPGNGATFWFEIPATPVTATLQPA